MTCLKIHIHGYVSSLWVLSNMVATCNILWSHNCPGPTHTHHGGFKGFIEVLKPSKSLPEGIPVQQQGNPATSIPIQFWNDFCMNLQSWRGPHNKVNHHIPRQGKWKMGHAQIHGLGPQSRPGRSTKKLANARHQNVCIVPSVVPILLLH